MKITIDFDPVLQEVVSVTVGNSTKTPKTPKTKEPSENLKKANEGLKVTLESNKLVLTPDVVTLLQVKEGDRLVIRYKNDGEFIQPFLAPAKVFCEEGGNKLTKSLSVSFRGDQHVSLLRFGTLFGVEDMKDGSVKLLSETKVQGDVPKPMSQETLDILSVIGEDTELSKTKFEIK